MTGSAGWGGSAQRSRISFWKARKLSKLDSDGPPSSDIAIWTNVSSGSLNTA